MSYYYVQVDINKNIFGWGNKSDQLINKELLEINNEIIVDEDVIKLLEKNREFKHKYINNDIINTNQSIFPPNQYSVWNSELNKWIDPRPQTAIIAEKWAEVRNQRNDLLVESDWTDTLSAKNRLGDDLYNDWQQYRQALRDVTNQLDPFTVTWPVPPQ